MAEHFTGRITFLSLN